ncbi:protein of unknown function [Reichenbachiella faecimaris]|uniref:DUF4145 domain-containing protein n=1 Tax=Reichenbachiella faecimaris TaxID=692418 RepID=A0A1W2G8C7_REIFA|nr:DUF4145 domain-containing protein [Reichenbachiella faecimaris]SMD32754.1 protein of unknown function [Reichenbachiella faecimaris]
MRKFELNKSFDKNYSVLCQTCKVTTKHKVLTSVNEYGKEPMDYGDFYQWNNDYEIIQCLGCETVSFRSDHANSEDYDPEDGDYYSNELLYPKRTKESLTAQSFFNVPHNLRRIYKETIESYNSDSLTLCGAGVRALVEGLCQENGIPDGEVEQTKKDGTIKKVRKTNLQAKINGLHEKGKITKANADILHEHRFLGNTAVHELSTPNKDDLRLALEIIENVFDNLYEIPEKASQLRFQRLRKNK